MTSRTGSLTTFNGEPKDDGPVLCFAVRGDPDMLRGESGGVLPAGNIDGNALLDETFVLLEFARAFNGVPFFASLIKDLT